MKALWKFLNSYKKAQEFLKKAKKERNNIQESFLHNKIERK